MPGQIGISKAILDAEKRKRARREAKAPGPTSRVKSELSVNEYNLTPKPTGGQDNSPNALEIGMKKAKEKAEESDSSMERKKDKGVRFTTSDGTPVAFRMKGFPKLKEVPEGNKGLAKLPEEVRNNMGFQRMNENMEMETVTPVNRHALQMMGRKGDEIPMMRSYGTPYKKRSAAGKAKLMKTKYGQTGKAILDKNLIKPIFKKAKGNK